MWGVWWTVGPDGGIGDGGSSGGSMRGKAYRRALECTGRCNCIVLNSTRCSRSASVQNDSILDQHGNDSEPTTSVKP